MRIVSVLNANRKLMAAGLVAMVAFVAGCGGGSDQAQSSAAPETPPPGESAKEKGPQMAKDIADHAKGAMRKN
jgi:hypothetical protein